MFSIYCAAYNLNSGMFDWESAIRRFSDFASEAVIATNSNYDYGLLHEKFGCFQKIKIINTNISFADYAFDGRLKNAALQACTQDYCILLDLDEIIPLSQKCNWILWASKLGETDFDGFAIPSVNLCFDEFHYKDIGHKFYLHKNHIGLERGVVDFAKLPNGKIDINKSDTTEILRSGQLAKFDWILNNLDLIRRANLPYVLHYWGVDKSKRIKQNEFWNPHWENRAGRKVDNDFKKPEDFDSIKVFEHNLPIE